MKILITGASGFIGRRLVPKLAERNKIICFVRETSRADDLKMMNVSFFYGDLLDKESIISAGKGNDIVIHLATSHHGGNELQNIEISRNVIESSLKNRIKKIIFISSMAAKRKNIDNYGRAKLEIERLIRKSGLNYVILRPSMIYSENGLGIIEKSLKIPFIIPIIGNGKYKINPVFIDDVVNSIKISAENKDICNKEYDVAGAENLEFNEFICLCKRRFNLRKMIIHIPLSLCILIFKLFPIISVDAARGIYEDTNADIANLRKDLKIRPISFMEGIKNVTL